MLTANLATLATPHFAAVAQTDPTATAACTYRELLCAAMQAVHGIRIVPEIVGTKIGSLCLNRAQTSAAWQTAGRGCHAQILAAGKLH